MDTRRLPRTAMAAALVLAPLTGLVAAVAHPALRTSVSAETSAIAAQQDRFYLYAIFMLISSYLLVPAFFGVLALLRERTPGWTFVAGVLAQTGLLIAVGDAATELVFWETGAPGADHAQMVALAERYDSASGSSLVYTIGGLATVVGVLLIAIALWRTRVTPRWAAAALLVGTGANVAGFVIASRPVLAGSYVVLLAAFAPIAATLLGSSVEPSPRTRAAATQARAATVR
jgi:hypothetical protein